MRKPIKETYTPGPWQVSTKEEFRGTSDDYHQIIAGNANIGSCVEPWFTLSGCIDIHDARLIAAAPEMLEALKKVLEQFRRPEWEIWCDHAVGICACEPLRLLESVDVLIKKAEGQAG